LNADVVEGLEPDGVEVRVDRRGIDDTYRLRFTLRGPCRCDGYCR
jgi:hypothetical protein